MCKIYHKSLQGIIVFTDSRDITKIGHHHKFTFLIRLHVPHSFIAPAFILLSENIRLGRNYTHIVLARSAPIQKFLVAKRPHAFLN